MKLYQFIFCITFFTTIDFALLRGAEEKLSADQHLHRSHKQFNISENSSFELLMQRNKGNGLRPNSLASSSGLPPLHSHHKAWLAHKKNSVEDYKHCDFSDDDKTLTSPPLAPSKQAQQKKAMHNKAFFSDSDSDCDSKTQEQNEDKGSPAQASEEY